MIDRNVAHGFKITAHFCSCPSRSLFEANGSDHRKTARLDKEERIGWEEIRRLVNGEPRGPKLFEKDQESPVWATVDIKCVSVQRLRRVGAVYLGLLLWNN